MAEQFDSAMAEYRKKIDEKPKPIALQDFHENRKLIFSDELLKVYTLSTDKGDTLGIALLHEAGRWGEWGWYLTREMAERFCMALLIGKEYDTCDLRTYGEGKVWSTKGNFAIRQMETGNHKWVGIFQWYEPSTLEMGYLFRLREYILHEKWTNSFLGRIVRGIRKKRFSDDNPALKERDKYDFVFLSDMDAIRLALSILDGLGHTGWASIISELRIQERPMKTDSVMYQLTGCWTLLTIVAFLFISIKSLESLASWTLGLSSVINISTEEILVGILMGLTLLLLIARQYSRSSWFKRT